MADPAILKAALHSVLKDMGHAARGARAAKFKRPEKVIVSEVEGGPTLDGIMNRPGNSGEDIAADESMSPEMMEEILRDAK